MDWQGHALLGWRAFGMLPEWEKSLVKPDLSEAALAKPYLPPGIGSAGEKMAAMCLIMDWIYYDECRPYATLPDGRWIPHSPADENFSSVAGTGLPISNAATATLIETLLNKMIDALKNEDGQHRLRTGNDQAAAGRLVVAFIALALHSELERRMHDAGLLRRMSVVQFLAQMRKIKSVNLAGGTRHLLEISQRNRDLMAAVGVPLPEELPSARASLGL